MAGFEVRDPGRAIFRAPTLKHTPINLLRACAWIEKVRGPVVAGNQLVEGARLQPVGARSIGRGFRAREACLILRPKLFRAGRVFEQILLLALAPEQVPRPYSMLLRNMIINKASLHSLD
jgi:hypothetical protein